MSYGDVDSPFVVSEPVVHEIPKKPKAWGLEDHQKVVNAVPKAPLEYDNYASRKRMVMVPSKLVRCRNCDAVIYDHLEFCACGYPNDRSTTCSR